MGGRLEGESWGIGSPPFLGMGGGPPAPSGTSPVRDSRSLLHSASLLLATRKALLGDGTAPLGGYCSIVTRSVFFPDGEGDRKINSHGFIPIMEYNSVICEIVYKIKHK